MKSICKRILGLAIFLSVPMGAAAAVTDPSVKWDVIKTNHFELIFDQRHKAIAKQYAKSAEKARILLKPYFKEMPDKTVVHILDTSDQTNGFASFLPYPSITVFPVLPDSLGSLDEYGIWSDLLMIHEYAHILTFEPAHGFYTPLKYIFGSIVTPTALLPRWYHEGLAVELETRLTRHGRLRSASLDAGLRALVHSGRLEKETLDRLNESAIPTWPFGERPYFFGSLLWHELMNEGGPQTINDLTQAYSRRLPFFLQGPVEDKFVQNYAEILSEMYANYRKRAESQLKAIQAAGDHGYKLIPHKGTHQVSPSISPDGKYLAYVAADPKTGQGELRLITRESSKADTSFSTQPFKMIKSTWGTLAISWLPDSSGFVFDQVAVYKRYYQFRDLFIYLVKDKRVVRLTEGERAWEPTVSPDGQSVAFVRQRTGGTELALLDIQKRTVSKLLRPKLQTRLAHPTFINAHQIIISGRELSGRERLFVYDLNTKKMKSVLPQHRAVSQPKWTPQGLIFVSQQSGVPNLYLADASFKSAMPITNSPTRVFNGDIDPLKKEVIISQLSDEGARLYVTPQREKQNPPQLTSLVSGGWPTPPRPEVQLKMEQKRYSSVKYLLPRYWIPFIYPVENGVLVQGSTGGTDPLGYHNYILEGSYDSVTMKGGYGAQYVNSWTPVDISLMGAESNEPLTGDSDIVLTNRLAAIGGSFYLTSSDRWQSAFNYAHLETRWGKNVLRRQGPSLGFSVSTSAWPDPTNTDEKSYRNLARLELLYTQFIEQKNYIDYGRTEVNLGAATDQWLPKRHLLSIQLKGAFAPEQPITTVGALGDRTVGGKYLASLITSSYLMRGYPSANFLGRELLNANIEYSFPLKEIYKGKGTFPVFMREISATLFADAVAVDGFYFNSDGNDVRTTLDQYFYSAGAELNLTTTTAYHFPINLIFGLYYGFDSEARGGFIPFLGLGISGVSAAGGLSSHQAQTH